MLKVDDKVVANDIGSDSAVLFSGQQWTSVGRGLKLSHFHSLGHCTLFGSLKKMCNVSKKWVPLLLGVNSLLHSSSSQKFLHMRVGVARGMGSHQLLDEREDCTVVVVKNYRVHFAFMVHGHHRHQVF